MCLARCPRQRFILESEVVSLSQWTLKKISLNFIFPTKYVIPKSLKFSHWPSKLSQLYFFGNFDIVVLRGRFFAKNHVFSHGNSVGLQGKGGMKNRPLGMFVSKWI